jgi:hypothetical protein
VLPYPAFLRRIYSDDLTKDNKQSFISWLVAVTTLTIYTGWMHVLIALMLASFFSRTCLYVLLAVWSTTFLPAKPVLWNAFCRSWVSQQQLQQTQQHLLVWKGKSSASNLKTVPRFWHRYTSRCSSRIGLKRGVRGEHTAADSSKIRFVCAAGGVGTLPPSCEAGAVQRFIPLMCESATAQ